jgi:KUP system potassium uptake protein
MTGAGAVHQPIRKQAPRGRYLLKLSLTALGVVYGDIGTSPLYAMRECFNGPHAVAITRGNVLGVLSLVFWALVLVISLKYISYVMRADNRGEGGILALLALATSHGPKGRALQAVIVTLGLAGAALLLGEGVITPAISVLSAVEGLEVATPGLRKTVLPITVAILIGLFAIQRRGTAGVGSVFGPITLLWFVSIGGLGLYHVIRQPAVLGAFDPRWAVQFFLHNKLHAFYAMSAVVLVITGAEALYADMGHFGAKPIRLAWFCIVFPGLILNYLGQGALLLEDPTAAESPFYRMAPEWALYPLVGLATLAAIIASQALISGAFSITRQATMLGFFPRVRIEHTSAAEIGQIYVPTINWFLMTACVAVVLGFKSSSNLAAAYGIAVTATMVITTCLSFVVARFSWNWNLPAAIGITLLFGIPDLAFLSATLVKVEQGGWFPLLMGASVFLLMSTWKRGRQLLGRRMLEGIVPLQDFYELLRVERPARVPGTAVFMASNLEGAPPALMQNFLHNRAVHQRVVLLTVVTQEVARVSEQERFQLSELQDGFIRLIVNYGFMEQPDIPQLLSSGVLPDFALEHTTFFLGRETLLAEGKHGMARWRERIFALMSRNSERATTFFRIPADRVMEIGSQVEL